MFMLQKTSSWLASLRRFLEPTRIIIQFCRYPFSSHLQHIYTHLHNFLFLCVYLRQTWIQSKSLIYEASIWSSTLQVLGCCFHTQQQLFPFRHWIVHMIKDEKGKNFFVLSQFSCFVYPFFGKDLSGLQDWHGSRCEMVRKERENKIKCLFW